MRPVVITLAVVVLIGLGLLWRRPSLPPPPPTQTLLPFHDCDLDFSTEPTDAEWACWWNSARHGMLVCPTPEANPLWIKLTHTFGCPTQAAPSTE
jgi:hypothetical protein